MSLLGKYRKEEEKREEDSKTEEVKSPVITVSRPRVTEVSKQETPVAVPNKERKSPIMSFSVTTELRHCLQAVRNEKAINLSMWVERKLREAIVHEFPEIAEEFLE
jgi:hypothetical protein